jgi:hypothetical protein
MISKHIPSSPSPTSSSSSSNLVFNTEALTTQTMSILHNTNHQQNGNLFNYDQQSQRVYIQNNGNYISSSLPSINQQRKNTFIENSPSNTNAAVLAALANGGFNSSSSQSQQTYYQQPQTISYSIPSSLNNNSTSKYNPPREKTKIFILFLVSNSRSSTPTSSYVIHHPPQSSLISRQLVVVNSSESLPSIETILNSSSQSHRIQPQISSKDSLSSHQTTSKQTLIFVPPTIKSLSTSINSSSIILPKTSNTNSIEKRSLNTTDDCLYVRYEREPSSLNYDQFRFSYIIDEHSPSLQKRLRYVSINDL